MAFGHACHITALPLTKANQNTALPPSQPDRQAGAVAVIPGRAMQRRQYALGCYVAQVLKVVFKHPLFDGHLRCGLKMLHNAAATYTKVWAGRRNAQG